MRRGGYDGLDRTEFVMHQRGRASEMVDLHPTCFGCRSAMHPTCCRRLTEAQTDQIFDEENLVSEMRRGGYDGLDRIEFVMHR